MVIPLIFQSQHPAAFNIKSENKQSLFFCEFSTIGRLTAKHCYYSVPFRWRGEGWASHDMTKWERWNECSLCYLLYAPLGEICDSTDVRSMRHSFVTYGIVQTWTSEDFPLLSIFRGSRDPDYVPVGHKIASTSPMKTQWPT
jgi:hypothetical protein